MIWFIFGVSEDACRKILDKSAKEKALRDCEYMEKNGIEMVCLEDKGYPEKFQVLVDKPVCFYVRGDKKILNREAIGIVGSRVALTESLEIARLAANAFVCQGVNVVSRTC